ncbi:MAG TPA: hypothetical protein VK171_11890 [Fimbriimonas sp.]|nr:hypothetical protein [Fimbriimonas sp.]
MNGFKLTGSVKTLLIVISVFSVQALIIADVYWTTYRPENSHFFRSGRDPGDHIFEGVLIESILVWGFVIFCCFIYYLVKNPHPKRDK